MATPQNVLLFPPERPAAVKPVVRSRADYNREYITARGYNPRVAQILSWTLDEIEREIGPDTYERMEFEPTIAKAKQILLTGMFSDEFQFAAGATEDEAGEEYAVFHELMLFADACLKGLDKPFRTTAEQAAGNSLQQGHSIAEITWETRTWPDKAAPDFQKARRATPAESQDDEEGQKTTPPAKSSDPQTPRLADIQPKPRFMPRTIKVKPRGAALFVSDGFWNILGFVPGFGHYRRAYNIQEVLPRDKGFVLTFHMQNEDPRGRSTYRPAYNWWNFKQHIPQEFLRYLLQCAVPGLLMNLPETGQGFEIERDEADNVVYEADGVTPKLLTPVESMTRQAEGYRNGTALILPHDAKAQPMKVGEANGEVFPNAMRAASKEMEDAILLQSLAQSEGEHQARAASVTHADLLGLRVFLYKYVLCVAVLSDVIEPAVRKSYGDWAVAYMPKLSLGDFEQRNWTADLAAVADAYFKGFLDDTQRAEIMAWLGLPKPGPSRAETTEAEIDPNTGSPRPTNDKRPDKQQGQTERNRGNATPKKEGASNNEQDTSDQSTRRGFFATLGHYGRRGLRTGPAFFSRR